MMIHCNVLFVFFVYCEFSVALPHDVTVCLHFVIVVFPDHTHLLFLHVYLYLPLLSSKETCMKNK